VLLPISEWLYLFLSSLRGFRSGEAELVLSMQGSEWLDRVRRNIPWMGEYSLLKSGEAELVFPLPWRDARPTPVRSDEAESPCLRSSEAGPTLVRSSEAKPPSVGLVGPWASFLEAGCLLLCYC